MDEKTSLNSCTDAELVRRSQKGESEAFDTLALRYLGAMFAVALARLREREAAEEAVQEALLRAYLSISDLKNPQKAGPWLTTIARNMALDWIKRGKRRSDILQLVPLADVEHALVDTAQKGARETMEQEETRSCLDTALNNLHPDEREMVLLHYAEGLNKIEISQQLGIHRTTVGRRLQSALKQMRSELEPVLREEGRKLRPSKKFQARTLLVISAAAALSAETKSAIAATSGTVAVTQASAAMAAIGTGAAFATDAAMKGSILMTLKAKIVALVAAVGLLGGGITFMAQESEDAARRTSAVPSMQINKENILVQYQESLHKINTVKSELLIWTDPTSAGLKNEENFACLWRRDGGHNYLGSVSIKPYNEGPYKSSGGTYGSSSGTKLPLMGFLKNELRWKEDYSKYPENMRRYYEDAEKWQKRRELRELSPWRFYYQISDMTNVEAFLMRPDVDIVQERDTQNGHAVYFEGQYPHVEGTNKRIGIWMNTDHGGLPEEISVTSGHEVEIRYVVDVFQEIQTAIGESVDFPLEGTVYSTREDSDAAVFDAKVQISKVEIGQELGGSDFDLDQTHTFRQNQEKPSNVMSPEEFLRYYPMIQADTDALKAEGMTDNEIMEYDRKVREIFQELGKDIFLEDIVFSNAFRGGQIFKKTYIYNTGDLEAIRNQALRFLVDSYEIIEAEKKIPFRTKEVRQAIANSVFSAGIGVKTKMEVSLSSLISKEMIDEVVRKERLHDLQNKIFFSFWRPYAFRRTLSDDEINKFIEVNAKRIQGDLPEYRRRILAARDAAGDDPEMAEEIEKKKILNEICDELILILSNMTLDPELYGIYPAWQDSDFRIVDISEFNVEPNRVPLRKQSPEEVRESIERVLADFQRSVVENNPFLLNTHLAPQGPSAYHMTSELRELGEDLKVISAPIEIGSDMRNHAYAMSPLIYNSKEIVVIIEFERYEDAWLIRHIDFGNLGVIISERMDFQAEHEGAEVVFSKLPAAEYVESDSLEALGMNVVSALEQDDFARIQGLFLTREQYDKVFSCEVDQDFLKSISREYFISASFLSKDFSDAEFVGLNLKYCPEPIELEAGRRIGPLKTKVPVAVTDNVRVKILLNGEPRELSLDTAIRVDGEWRLMWPVRLVDKQKPIEINTRQIIRLLESGDIKTIATKHSQRISITLRNGESYSGKFNPDDAGEYAKIPNLREIGNLTGHIKKMRGEEETKDWSWMMQ